MLFEYLRLLKSAPSEIEDLSYSNQDESESINLSLNQDQSFLIGMNYPFNNFFAHLDKPNAPLEVTTTSEIVSFEDPVEGLPEVQMVAFSRVPTEGNFSLGYNDLETPSLNFDSSLVEIQAAIQSLTGLEDVIVEGSYASGLMFKMINVADPQDVQVLGNTLKATVKAKLKLSYWNGRNWVSAVDVLDGTAKEGVTLSRSGNILFSHDKDEAGWARVANPPKSGPPELESMKIYDLYWLKVELTEEVNPETSLKEVAFAFTAGDKLRGVKAEVDKFFDAFKKGKTDWLPEIITASKMLVTELKKSGVVLGPQQIVRLDDFWLPATYKTLWLIYSSLGPAYVETANWCNQEFQKSFNVNYISVDQNLNGVPDVQEQDSRVKVGVR